MPHTTADEGVIKFELQFHSAPALPAGSSAPLRAWHRICHRLGLLGRDPDRYGGYAYGNLSLRSLPGFLISGTQTAGRPELGPDDYAEVLSWDVAANRVEARGPCRPSSESITHGMIYDCAPSANCVVHAHHPAIWSRAERLGIATTDADIAYGTPEMAFAVRELFDSGALGAEQGLFVMLGHEDGVVSYGADTEAAGGLMVMALSRAQQLVS